MHRIREFDFADQPTCVPERETDNDNRKLQKFVCVATDQLSPAPLKLRPYGTLEMCLLFLLL